MNSLLGILVIYASAITAYSVSHLGGLQVDRVAIWMTVMSWWVVFIYVRNISVSRCRTRINNEVFRITGSFVRAHEAFSVLPKYDVMMLNPRFWHLWTFKQWYSYVKRRLPIEVIDHQNQVIKINFEDQRRKTK